MGAHLIHEKMDYTHLGKKNGFPCEYFRIDLMNLKTAQVKGQAFHAIAGKRYPLELHLVHENSRKQTLVVGVFIRQGKENKNLDYLIDGAVTKIQNGTGHKLSLFNASKLLPQSKTHYLYTGSQTTPPCSEGVTWILLNTPIEDSEKNIKYFKTNIVDHKSRSLQKLKQRLIFKIIQ